MNRLKLLLILLISINTHPTPSKITSKIAHTAYDLIINRKDAAMIGGTVGSIMHSTSFHKSRIDSALETIGIISSASGAGALERSLQPGFKAALKHPTCFILPTALLSIQVCTLATRTLLHADEINIFKKNKRQ